MVNVTSVDENTHYQAENTLILLASRCVLLKDIMWFDCHVTVTCC